VVVGFGFLIFVVFGIEALMDRIRGKSGGDTGSAYYYSPDKPKPGVVITRPENLTSWALHKYPEDIELHDIADGIATSFADTVIHRDGGINVIIKGRDKGRKLENWEVDDYIDSL
jgi:hypothetical protein